MKIRLKKLRSTALLPKQATKGDFCYDVWATSEEEIRPGTWKYGLGFKYEMVRDQVSQIPDGWNICIDLRPRSGISKTGMVLCNSEGTLDEFFRGEACALFYQVMTGDEYERYHVGDKIAQIKIGIAPPAEFEWVDEIDENTERGEGGFGHTGQK